MLFLIYPLLTAGQLDLMWCCHLENVPNSKSWKWSKWSNPSEDQRNDRQQRVTQVDNYIHYDIESNFLIKPFKYILTKRINNVGMTREVTTAAFTHFPFVLVTVLVSCEAVCAHWFVHSTETLQLEWKHTLLGKSEQCRRVLQENNNTF